MHETYLWNVYHLLVEYSALVVKLELATCRQDYCSRSPTDSWSCTTASSYSTRQSLQKLQ
ncbi:hypothetical protein EI94DRAFT_1749038 [Lactarius quietus]|nr:hypothetical protein EI94DRAFT_1749038 [Lactarius quietus]